ncbi:MAG: ABC transporter permease, partial [Bdellovibrionota bacterium]
ILAKSAFGSLDDFAMTLFYATPLIFTGLSVAIAFHAGLFNIGAEGQLTFGALSAAAVGMLFPSVPGPFAPLLGVLAAFCGGAVWGFLPGWLRARRGSHEVITTIMLNFVAAGLASWVTLYVLRNTETQNPETKPIGAEYLLSRLPGAGDAPLTGALFLAFLCAGLVWVFLWRTPSGFQLRATGENENAAETAGIDSARIRILAMTLAGGLAGLVGVGEVLGNAGKFRLGFSADFGFTGIAVALLARNSPIGVVFAAVLFGALHKGSGDLDFETENVTRELALIFQALVILAVVAEGLWDRILPKKGGKIG